MPPGRDDGKAESVSQFFPAETLGHAAKDVRPQPVRPDAERSDGNAKLVRQLLADIRRLSAVVVSQQERAIGGRQRPEAAFKTRAGRLDILRPDRRGWFVTFR